MVIPNLQPCETTMMYFVCWSWMCHVLVAKGLWSVVIGAEVRLASCEESASLVEDDSGASSSKVAPIKVPTTQEQRKWDGRDAHAHAHALLEFS